MSARADVVGVGDARVDREEFGPTIAAAEILFRQFPERIAALHADSFLCGDRGGIRRGARLKRGDRCEGRGRLHRLGRNGRLHRLDENAWPGKHFWLRWSKQPDVRPNCWTHISADAGMIIC